MKVRRPTQDTPVEVTGPVQGRPIEIGGGFSALSFDHEQFGGLMDPLVMVDHFVMSEPTFGAHAHAGMSAVSVLFEDSQGLFHNRDSLGNQIDLEPGDLYWLKAGRGAVHDEGPRPGARTHALQVFVNLPAASKHEAPESLHVRGADMPELRGESFRVRVILGHSNGVSGSAAPALPLTILEAQLEAGGVYLHPLPAGCHAWIHAVRGRGQVRLGDTVRDLDPSIAIALRGGVETGPLELCSDPGAQVVLIQGEPIREHIARRGPFVMSTREELDAVAEAYAAGELGSID